MLQKRKLNSQRGCHFVGISQINKSGEQLCLTPKVVILTILLMFLIDLFCFKKKKSSESINSSFVKKVTWSLM